LLNEFTQVNKCIIKFPLYFHRSTVERDDAWSEMHDDQLHNKTNEWNRTSLIPNITFVQAGISFFLTK
jgi:hypothetical protein